MKYRVRMDLSFNNEADARSLMNYAKTMAGNAVSSKEYDTDIKIPACRLEFCGHDETPPHPCVILDQWEIGKSEVL